MKKLFLHNIVKETSVLGRGKRYTLWLQGCKQNCKGCFSPETQPLNKNGYDYPLENIIDDIKKNSSLDGLTITGGEPFLQAENLFTLILQLKEINPKLNYIIYSGYSYNYLLNSKDKNIRNLLDSVDLLIDGNYDENLNDNIPLIGSSNQRVNIFTNSGFELAEYMQSLKIREIEFVITQENYFSIVGIPPKKSAGFLQQFEQKLFMEK